MERAVSEIDSDFQSGGWLCSMGKKVIQIGCDPKADSTINLLGGEPLRPVMNYMREEDEEPEKLEDISREGSEVSSVLKQVVRHRDSDVPEEESLRHSSCWKI